MVTHHYTPFKATTDKDWDKGDHVSSGEDDGRTRVTTSTLETRALHCELYQNPLWEHLYVHSQLQKTHVLGEWMNK